MKRGIGMKEGLHGENLETAISGGGPGSAGKEKEIYEYPSGGGRT